jgi:hypothetical protein
MSVEIFMHKIGDAMITRVTKMYFPLNVAFLYADWTTTHGDTFDACNWRRLITF